MKIETLQENENLIMVELLENELGTMKIEILKWKENLKDENEM